ncbi:SCP2 sterol-binding domain-containing protein [Evansella sp. AB-rgal1]|uniref:SCP2 sterol-binding domain-containing protein n=1 Tax=Evansella sp. AB-rgal1 TaxID=3242696 RepID=UPI00359CC22A
MSEKQATLLETVHEIEKMLNENPEPISDVQLIYEFQITGDEAGTFQLHLQDGQAKVTEEATSPPDCTLIMSFDSFQKFLDGKLSGTAAFMTGKLKVKGEIPKALKLESILKQYH